MVQGVPQIEGCNETCEECAFKKHHKDVFEAGNSWSASKPLELIHTYVGGPMQIATFSENKYYPTFIVTTPRCIEYIS